MPSRIPTRFLSRAAATARMAAHLGKAGALHLVRSSTDDDEKLGESLFGELDRLKGLAMKVGQILSYMEVGLPDATVHRLAMLQHGSEPVPASVILTEIEREFNAPLSTLFERFDPIPVAAASIGQVHRAAVHGREVAVKIQYPGIRSTLDADTRQLRVIASLASLATAVDGAALVAELRDRLLEECDYRLEATHQERFACILAKDEALFVPPTIRDRCGASVLTTEWQEGERFDTLLAADSSRRSAVAQTLSRFPWMMLFGHGLLHVDPHPGNFIFPGENRVTILDFGCIKQFTRIEVESFRELIRVILDEQRSKLPEVAQQAGLVPYPERIDFEELWAMFTWMFEPYHEASFHFHRDWWARGLVFTRPTNRNARHLGFPLPWLWLQRTTIGLHSVLTKLGATGNFATLLRDALDCRLTSQLNANR